METKEIIKELYDILPDDLQNDKFLENLWSLIINSCTDHSFLVGRISVNENLYSKLDFNLISEDKVLVRNDDVVMSFLVIAKRNVLLRIKRKYGLYVIEAKIPNSGYMTIITAIKNKYMTRVETICIDEKDGLYDVYDCDIKYYDHDYKEMHHEKADIEREKDMVFAAEFAIPLNMARFFRNNFNLYRKQLSANLASVKMKQNNDTLKEDDLFRFCTPFKLEELEEYASLFQEREIEAFLRKLGDDYSLGDSNNALKGDISILKNHLLNQIGEGNITMSYNMISDIGELVNGKINMTGLTTKGYILKKENDGFSIYRVEISNGDFRIIRGFITRDEALLVFKRNSKNENVEGLKDFFLGDRGLK